MTWHAHPSSVWLSDTPLGSSEGTPQSENSQAISALKYREQHKLRLAWMPWLYDSLKPHQKEWARAWQEEIQRYLSNVETVHFGEDCFVAPSARLFAEPGRMIDVGSGARIAADVFAWPNFPGPKCESQCTSHDGWRCCGYQSWRRHAHCVGNMSLLLTMECIPSDSFANNPCAHVVYGLVEMCGLVQMCPLQTA